MSDKCKNCGAVAGLHHYQTDQCPVGWWEDPIGRKQEWRTTTEEPHDNCEIRDVHECEKDELEALLDAAYARIDALVLEVERLRDAKPEPKKTSYSVAILDPVDGHVYRRDHYTSIYQAAIYATSHDCCIMQYTDDGGKTWLCCNQPSIYFVRVAGIMTGTTRADGETHDNYLWRLQDAVIRYEEKAK